MILKFSNKKFSTTTLHKLYTFSGTTLTPRLVNFYYLYNKFCFLNSHLYDLVLISDYVTLFLTHNLLYQQTLKFFDKYNIWSNKKGKKNKNTKNKNILILIKSKRKVNYITTHRPEYAFTQNHQFLNYRTMFKRSYFNLFNPMVKIRNSRKFPFFQKKHLSKPLRPSRKIRSLQFKKRAWFILFLSKQKIKTHIIRPEKNVNVNYSRYLRLENIILRGKSIDRSRTKKNHLTPRQHLFLNSYKNKVKATLSKPFKSIILKKIRSLYKRRLFKTKINKIGSKLRKKHFKASLKSLLNKKRSRVFCLTTLAVSNKFSFLRKALKVKTRPLSSRRKMILHKKHFLTMVRYFRIFSNSRRLKTFNIYFKRVRTRFLSWRFRQIVMRKHRIKRITNLFYKNQRGVFKQYNNKPHNQKTIISGLNWRIYVKFYRKKKWATIFRKLIKVKTKAKIKRRIHKVINKKLARKSHAIITKKTKKVKKLRRKFKPSHRYLRKFSRKVKRFIRTRYSNRRKVFQKLVKKSLKVSLTELNNINTLVSNKGISKVYAKQIDTPVAAHLEQNNLDTRTVNKWFNTPFNYNDDKQNTILKSKRFFNPNYRYKYTQSYFLVNKRAQSRLKNWPSDAEACKTPQPELIKKVDTSRFTKNLKVAATAQQLNLIKNIRAKQLQSLVNYRRKFTFKSVRSFFNHTNNTTSMKTTNKTKKKLTIYSKHRTPFILANYGFLFIQGVPSRIKTKLQSKVNRYKYSFFYLNDIKRFFLRKPNKFKLLASSIFKNKSLRTKFFDVKRFENFSNNTFLLNINSTLKSENFTFKNSFLYTQPFINHIKKEVRIKRIKFKPGYSRIWRNARKAINKSLNFNLKYQYRLTREITRLSRCKTNTHVFIKELTVLNLLLNSHFVTDTQLAQSLIDSNSVFINGSLVSNSNLNLFPGDFLQLVTNLKFYITYRWMLNWTRYKKVRLSKLAKVKFKKQSIMKDKQRSYNLPDWILTSRIKTLDIPKYLEVDFFTLSSFIIYEPFLVTDLNPLNVVDTRTEILNMYNWKYIN